MANAQTLPIELVLRIFRFVAQSSQRNALTLSHVSRAVRYLALQRICFTAVLARAEECGTEDRTLAVHGSPNEVVLPNISDVEREEDLTPIDHPYLHSLCIPASDNLSYAPNLPFTKIADSFLSNCKLRRIRAPYLPIVALFYIWSSQHSVNAEHRFSGLRELELSSRDTNHIFPRSILQSPARWRSIIMFPFAGLTHLRVVKLSQENVLTLSAKAGTFLPALTHLAFNLHDPQLSDASRYEVSDPDIMGMVNRQGGRASLQVLLLLVASEPRELEEETVQSFTETPTDDHRIRNLASCDSRIVSMAISTADDWHLWLRLAKENKNIWDEALRRGQDNINWTLLSHQSSPSTQ